MHFDGHTHDDTSQVQWANGVGIDVVRGHGRLAGERTVEVTSADGVRTLHARHAVVLATGTSAAVPPIPGLREALPWISRDVTNMHVVPRRVAVIGGGVVACEAATWLAGLGVAELTVIGSAPTLLARNEGFAGEMVAGKLREHGVTVHLGVSVDGVSRADPADTGEGNVHGGEVTVSFGGTVDHRRRGRGGDRTGRLQPGHRPGNDRLAGRRRRRPTADTSRWTII